MMNMFKLSEQLKDFSKDQLVREMKMPSGSVPQFLVLTELQRRTRMEREAQGGDAPEQSTVAQDAVAAAGVPQGGVAQMAQALAPKTDMAGNTGIAAMAPQAAPAPVQRMQEGGEVEAPEDRTIMRRILSALRNRERPVGDDEYAAWLRSRMDSDLGIITPTPDMLNPVDAALDAVRYADEGNFAGAALNAASLVPIGRPLSIARAASQAAPETYERVMDREAPPTRTREQRMEDAMLGLGVDAEFAYPTRRMQEGGEIEDVPSIAEILSDRPVNPLAYGILAGISEPHRRAFIFDRINRRGDLGYERARRLAEDLPPAPTAQVVSTERYTPFNPGQSSRAPGPYDAPDSPPVAVPATTADVAPAFDVAPALPPDVALASPADVAPALPGPRMPEEAETELPEVSDDPTGRGERRERRDGGAGLSPRNPFAFIEEAITQPPTYGPADGSTGRRSETPEMLAERVARSFETEAEAADLETAPRPTRERLPGLGGPPDDRARGPSDETRELAEQFEEEAEAADREIADLPGGVAPDLGIETPAAPDGGAGGGGSRTGTLGDIDRMYEQDKWLSLARFGLGLMASSQPTLGGAIGEAGGAALDSLSQAREDLLQRRVAEAQLARRGGGGGGREGGLDRRDLDLLETRMEMLRDRIMDAQTEGERLQAQNDYTAAANQYAFLSNYLYAQNLDPAAYEVFRALEAPPPAEEPMDVTDGFWSNLRRNVFGD